MFVTRIATVILIKTWVQLGLLTLCQLLIENVIIQVETFSPKTSSYDDNDESLPAVLECMLSSCCNSDHC